MIGPAIFSLLYSDTAVESLTSSRITPGIIPQNQDVPCIYYETDNIRLIGVRNPMGCFTGSLVVGFQVSEDSYDQLEELTAAINKRLENFSGKSEDVALNIGRGQSTPDDFDPNLRYHTRAIEYPITGQILTQ